jgi:hypothetical protein
LTNALQYPLFAGAEGVVPAVAGGSKLAWADACVATRQRVTAISPIPRRVMRTPSQRQTLAFCDEGDGVLDDRQFVAVGITNGRLRIVLAGDSLKGAGQGVLEVVGEAEIKSQIETIRDLRYVKGTIPFESVLDLIDQGLRSGTRARCLCRLLGA